MFAWFGCRFLREKIGLSLPAFEMRNCGQKCPFMLPSPCVAAVQSIEYPMADRSFCANTREKEEEEEVDVSTKIKKGGGAT